MKQFTPEESEAFAPADPPSTRAEGLDRARRAMQQAGCWQPGQRMGVEWPIACVALEITQRCNLDCTCCYLSEHSEAVQDLPLEELLRRVDLIHRHYGDRTNVQITGGDPTLRPRDELLAIVRRVRERKLRATLMTNGIRATRPLLEALCAAGLTDVAFHVDTTQRIEGYGDEIALNTVRDRYLERTRGLPLSVMFNTTVHAGNFEAIPDLVRYFRDNVEQVRTASFQPQAQTGRGIAEPSPEPITMQAVAAQICRGAGTQIRFDTLRVGHPSCSRYGLCLAVNGRLYDLLDEPTYLHRIDAATAHIDFDRTQRRRGLIGVLKWLGRHPDKLMAAGAWAGRKLRRIVPDLIRARGRASTLSFVVHDFMDAASLDRSRIHACAFKVMTGEGPVSMCLHNARRDAHILAPIRLPGERAGRFWQPLTGKISDRAEPAAPVNPDSYPRRRLKGRARRRVIGDPTITARARRKS
jgi:pyruvate-formate lyase-activating enzyme